MANVSRVRLPCSIFNLFGHHFTSGVKIARIPLCDCKVFKFASNYKPNPEQSSDMVQFYHINAKLAITPAGKCRTVGAVQYHLSCSSLPCFTQANEVRCMVRPE